MNKYCVYYHVDNFGNIRYIGSGTIYRARQLHAKSLRGRKYEDYVKESGTLSFVILHENLSMTKAREIELEEYVKIEDKSLLLNVNPPSKIKDMSMYNFDKYFYYDESSITCIRRKYIHPYDKRNKLNEPAGYLHESSGYFCVSIGNRSFQISRVVWVLFNGEIQDGFVIDHINGDIKDNKISNLRAVSIAENTRNRSSRKNKRQIIIDGKIIIDDLPTGITKKTNCNSLVARVSVFSEENIEPRLIQKSFNAKTNDKHGYDEALQMAIAWRKSMIDQLNKQGAGYSDRHGK